MLNWEFIIQITCEYLLSFICSCMFIVGDVFSRVCICHPKIDKNVVETTF